MIDPVPRKSKTSVTVGVTLIVSSFVIYPAYPAIALLPFSLEVRFATAFVASVASWAVFFAGLSLAGKEGVDYLKRLLTRRKAPPPVERR